MSKSLHEHKNCIKKGPYLARGSERVRVPCTYCHPRKLGLASMYGTANQEI